MQAAHAAGGGGGAEGPQVLSECMRLAALGSTDKAGEVRDAAGKLVAALLLVSGTRWCGALCSTELTPAPRSKRAGPAALLASQAHSAAQLTQACGQLDGPARKAALDALAKQTGAPAGALAAPSAAGAVRASANGLVAGASSARPSSAAAAGGSSAGGAASGSSLRGSTTRLPAGAGVRSSLSLNK